MIKHPLYSTLNSHSKVLYNPINLDGYVLALTKPYIGSDKWIDYSGYGNDGIIHGVTKDSDGFLSFDGIDDYVDCGNPASLRLTRNFYVETMIYKDSTQSDILGKWNVMNNKGWGITANDDSFHIAFRLGPNDYWGGYGDTSLENSKWYRLAFSYIGDGTTPKMWVNGIEQNVSVWSNNGDGLNGITDSGENLTIGRSHIFSGSYKYFKGIIPIVRILSNRVSTSQSSFYPY